MYSDLRRRGRHLVILGDTSDPSCIAEAGRGADLLVHEATFSSGLRQKALERGHSTAHMAGVFAKELQARTLALTHFSNRYQDSDGDGDEGISQLMGEARAAFGGRVVAAEDFMQMQLPRHPFESASVRGELARSSVQVNCHGGLAAREAPPAGGKGRNKGDQ